jgi:methionine-S-sulfoxide reductase
VLAGGCFWGVEQILREVPGVLDTDVGYTGGWLENPTYHDTHDSKSGHAEAIRVTFDPTILSYETLLEQWFFKLHDPTTLNRQGNDVGTQYRSAIYTTTPEQEKVAREVTERYQPELTERRLGQITTEIKPSPTYYYAEDHHQQYLLKNPFGYRCHSSTGVPYPR